MDDETRTALETIAYVVRSPSRVRILELLREGEAVPRDELRSSVDGVRTTLQRNLQGLAERGLVRECETATAYEITPVGALVADAVTDAASAVESATALRPVLDAIPTSTMTFDLERLADATVVEATTANPYAPVERHEARLAETDHARLLLPAAGAEPLETSREMVEAGAVHDAIVTPSVAETLASDPAFEDAFAELADSERVSVSVLDEEIPFYLGVLDDVVQLGVQDESGLPTALLESRDPAVREWAIDRFETVAERADRLV